MTDLGIRVCPSSARMSKEGMQRTMELLATGDPNGEVEVWWGLDRPANPTKGPFSTQQAKSLANRWAGIAVSYVYFPWVLQNDDNLLFVRNAWFTGGSWMRGNGRTHLDMIDSDLNMDTMGVAQHYGTSFCSDAAHPANWAKFLDPTEFPKNLGNGGGKTVYRVKEGVERFFITDINNPAGSAQAQSTVPVSLDSIAYAPSGGSNVSRFNHTPGGCNVLFMDGHVEFIKYIQGGDEKGTFPVTTAAAIERLGGYGGSNQV
jgi:prepilin-type processing-associated H-X9-DG protein